MAQATRHQRTSSRPKVTARSTLTILSVLLPAFGLPLLATAENNAGWQSLSVIQEIRNWSYDNYTRVVIYSNKKIPYTVKELPADPANKKPPRIYLNLSDSRLDPSIRSELTINDGLLTKARVAQFDKQTARLVLDLNSISRYQVVPFRDPDRIVIDVFGKESQAQRIEPAIPAAKSKVVDDPLAAILGGEVKGKSGPTNPPSFRKQPVIVVDAGHGGKDPGAIGYKNLYEKNVVLKVANKVAAKLRQSGYKVVQTRKTDRFLKLEERTIIANGQEADLFVSIHANSAQNPAAHGIETYHLAPASDKRAQELAARENAISGDGDFDALDELLQALNFSNKLHVSSALAQFVQQNVSSVIGRKQPQTFKDLGVKGAPFYVLVGTNMAAVLVEIGFVTNPKEAKLLKSDRYQDYLATGIVQGIGEYIKKLKKIPI